MTRKWIIIILLALACREAPPGRDSTDPTPQPTGPSGPLVVFLGDSLTAGLGVAESEAFPARLGVALGELGIECQVANAGVSGDTSASGLARLDWLLSRDPDILVVGLGANDGLRGLPLDHLESNLRQILERTLATDADVILLQMHLPPSHGRDYADAFAAIYPRLAEDHDVTLAPFLLDGVAGVLEQNQTDGLHPTADGHAQVAENLHPVLVDRLRAVEQER